MRRRHGRVTRGLGVEFGGRVGLTSSARWWIGIENLRRSILVLHLLVECRVGFTSGTTAQRRKHG